jgi:hypothetical protein
MVFSKIKNIYISSIQFNSHSYKFKKKTKKKNQVQLKINNIYLKIKKWYIYIKNRKKITIITQKILFTFSIGLNFNRLI